MYRGAAALARSRLAASVLGSFRAHPLAARASAGGRYLTSAPVQSAAIGSAEKNGGAKNDEGSKDKKDSESSIPWGLLITLAFVGSIAGYFYRGKQNSKRLKALQDKISATTALSADEQEELYDANQVTLDQFQMVLGISKVWFPSGRADPLQYFSYCGKLLKQDSGGKLASWHLIERACSALTSNSADGLVDLPTLQVITLVLVKCHYDIRIAEIFKIFTCLGKQPTPGEPEMTYDQLVAALDVLQRVWQLPVRTMTREVSEYPFNLYLAADATFLASRALEEIVKARKKEKTLTDELESYTKQCRAVVDYQDKVAAAQRQGKTVSRGFSGARGILWSQRSMKHLIPPN